MAGTTERQLEAGGLLKDFFSFSVYKRSQGRVARQVTFAVLALTCAIAAWRLAQQLPLWFAPGANTPAGDDLGVIRLLVPALVGAIGWWMAFRVVNVPRFADFLIAVESEMAKVSWPTADEVFRSSVVIIFLMFALAGILAMYDLFWWFVLRSIQGIG
jgi:preprotein translocase subunit SecE